MTARTRGSGRRRAGSRRARARSGTALLAAVIVTTLALPMSPASAATVPGAPTTVVAEPGDAFVWVIWDPPASDGGSPITGYTATASPGGKTCTWTEGPVRCVVNGLTNGTPYSFTVRATNAAGAGPVSVASNTTTPSSTGTTGTRFHPIPPTRLLDSRGPTGGWNGPLLSSTPRSLVVTGGLVPTTASAVVMNITATGATAPSFLTVRPAGEEPNDASNLNFAAGQTIANLATVKTGIDKLVRFENAVGSVDVVADAVGYFDDGTGPGDRFNGLTPTRILDTREPALGWSGPLTAGTPRTLAVRGTGGVPADATAVIGNLTVTRSTQGSFLAVWPSGLARPTSSNVNFARGQTIPNLTVVQLGTDGALQFANEVGSTDVVFDVVGYFSAASGSLFHPLSPTRILDDRVPIGLIGPWGPGQSRSLQVTGSPSVPGSATDAMINVTTTNGTLGSFLTVFPDDVSRPNASNVNFGPGETIPNLAVVRIAPNGRIAIANELGSVDVVGDIVGFFAPT